MTDQPIAIVHQIVTVSVTFVEKPNDETRARLEAAGYHFDNGQWYRSDAHAQHADAEMFAQVIAA